MSCTPTYLTYLHVRYNTMYLRVPTTLPGESAVSWIKHCQSHEACRLQHVQVRGLQALVRKDHCYLYLYVPPTSFVVRS